MNMNTPQRCGPRPVRIRRLGSHFHALRNGFPLRSGLAILGWCLAGMLLTGCVAPIGADRVTTQQAYAQVEGSALLTGKPSGTTVAILHRFDLDRAAAKDPDEAVRQLHEKAVATGDRDLLFALAEMSYVAGEQIRRAIKPWDPRDPRDYYLGSAVYAWLYLFGDGRDPKPDAFDRRFRLACDFYNYSLGLALVADRRGTNATVRLQGGPRRLPVGSIELKLDTGRSDLQLEGFDQIDLADAYRVRGLSVRNRNPGIGAPLICVRPLNPDFEVRQSLPATVLLHAPFSLSELGSDNGPRPCSLEVFSEFTASTVSIRGTEVPIETDLTAFRAYTLSQSTIWNLGKLQFLAPSEYIPSQLMMNQPYDPGRIPVVFVHGTFSSPVTWAEMANTLIADPVLRERYQVWTFVYGSGNNLARSVGEFRAALSARIQELDPAGTNQALRQMIIIGHSQGGLLTKGTAIRSEDKIWKTVSTNRFEDLNVPEAQRAELRRMLFLEPLPFVKRVIFIATPHRGSYMASGFVRSLAHRLVSLPRATVSRRTEIFKLAAGSEQDRFLRARLPTSLDAMSPKNPALLVLSEIPVSPSITAHSIVAVEDEGDYRKGRDGLVTYESAHQDYVKSEFVVRSFHSCLDNPATIEEVRRILREHLEEQK